MAGVCLYLVVQDDSLVHNLLELGVLQIVPNHHLENLKQFSVGNKTVIVHVVNPTDQNIFCCSLKYLIYARGLRLR